MKASNTDCSDRFGCSVAASGDTVVVGAHNEASSATGVNGNQSENIAGAAGATYVFVQDGTTWSQQAYLKASNTGRRDHFGRVVAVSGDTVVVGAFGEASNAAGVNGDQSDDSASLSGAAYVFDLDAPPPGTPFCFGDPGSGAPCPCSNDNDGSEPGSGCDNGVFASGAKMVGSGLASVGGDTLVLTCTHLEPENFGLYFQGDSDLSPGYAWGDGLRCAGPDLVRLQVRFADAAGTSSTTIGIAAKAGNVNAGDTKYYQCWYRNPLNSPCGNEFNSSNGYAITWLP